MNVKKHILLVDDVTLMRKSLTFGLEHAGYRTTSIASAEAALEIAARIHLERIKTFSSACLFTSTYDILEYFFHPCAQGITRA